MARALRVETSSKWANGIKVEPPAPRITQSAATRLYKLEAFMDSLEHLQPPLCLSGAPLCLGSWLSFGAKPPPWRWRSTASAAMSAFAVEDRSSLYHRARGGIAWASLVGSRIAMSFLFLSADSRKKSTACWRAPPAESARSATPKSTAVSPLDPASIRGSHPFFRNFLPLALSR